MRTPRLPGVLAAVVVGFAVVSAGCDGSQADGVRIDVRGPLTASPAGIKSYVVSVSNSAGVIVRTYSFSKLPSPLTLEGVPAGKGMVFSLVALDHDVGNGNTVAVGLTCPVDIAAGGPPPALSMFAAPLGSFSPTSDPPGPPRELPLAVVRPDSKVLLAGGTNAGQVLTDAQLYDPRTGTWSASTQPITARSGAAVVSLDDGELVIGGQGANNVPEPSVDYFDADRGLRTVGSDPSYALRGLAAAALVGSKALVAGGITASGAVTDAAWIFSDRENLITAGQMLAVRRDHSMTVVGGSDNPIAFIVGGAGADGKPLASIERFDASDGFVAETAQLATPRFGHKASVLPTGEIAIVGGQGAGGPVSSVELFNPVSRTMLSKGNLADARVEHAQIQLGDGRVLVSGGRDAHGQPLASVEIYDPVIHDFVAEQPMGTPRAGHVMAPLCDGTMLVVGGGPGAEIYMPPRR